MGAPTPEMEEAAPELLKGALVVLPLFAVSSDAECGGELGELGDEGAPVTGVGAPPFTDGVIAVCDVVPEAVPALELEEGFAGELGCAPVVAEAPLVAVAEAVFAAWLEVIPSACVIWARLMVPVEGGAVAADAEPAIVGFIAEEVDCGVVDPGVDAIEDAKDADVAEDAGAAEDAKDAESGEEDDEDRGEAEVAEEADEAEEVEKAEAFSDDELDVDAGEAPAAIVDDPVEPTGAEFIAAREATELFDEELTPLAEGGDPGPCDDDDPLV